MILFNKFLTNTNTNIFELTPKGKYKYKYILVDNTITITDIRTGICDYKYE